jgi:hypothetical protein
MNDDKLLALGREFDAISSALLWHAQHALMPPRAQRESDSCQKSKHCLTCFA